MKKILTLTLGLGLVMAASAQYGRVYDPGPHIVIEGHMGHYDRFERQRRIEEINRNFDEKIWQVRRDPYLRHGEKKRMIRNLNIEREERIREIRRWK
jgi:hypothetical protein